MTFSPVTAQKDKFDAIQCSRLEVVNSEGKVQVILSTNPLDMMHSDVVWIGVGRVAVSGKDGKSGARVDVTEQRGLVDVFGKDGTTEAALGVDEYGGFVMAVGKARNSQAQLSIDEYGGLVGTQDKHARFKLLG